MAASKVHAIVKLSGSFALGGLAINSFTAADKEPCFQSIFAFLLRPAEVHTAALLFTQKASHPNSLALTPFHALDESGNYKKVYPVELRLKPISSQFTASCLVIAALRASAITYLPLIEQYFQELKQAEEDNEEVQWSDLPEFDWIQAKEKLPQATFSIAREIVVGVLRVLLAWLAAENLEPRLAWKLTKDQRQSLKRKQRHPFYLRPLLVTQTVIRGMAIQTLAEFIFASTVESARVFWSKQVPRDRKWKVLARRLTYIPFRLIVNGVASAVAAGIVGIFRPGFLCVLAEIMAPFAVDTFICVPAIHKYESQGKVSKSTVITVATCAGLVICCFWPWIAAKTPEANIHANTQLAVS